MATFAERICRWYGEEQHERLRALYSIIGVLEFLALPARQQQDIIPDCPACEAWSTYMLPVHELINAHGAALPDDICGHLERVWAGCGVVRDSGLPCHDRGIFEVTAWQGLRDKAGEPIADVRAGGRAKRCAGQVFPDTSVGDFKLPGARTGLVRHSPVSSASGLRCKTSRCNQ